MSKTLGSRIHDFFSFLWPLPDESFVVVPAKELKEALRADAAPVAPAAILPIVRKKGSKKKREAKKKAKRRK